MCKMKSIEFYIEKANKIHNYFYSYEKFIYLGVMIRGIITCPVHGDFLQCMNHHTNTNDARGCPKCANVGRGLLSQEEYLKKCLAIHMNDYDLSAIRYTNSRGKVTPICRKHGIWETRADKFVAGEGCPSCRISKGENKIRKILIENNIVFEQQKTFPDCKGIRNLLSFDFYLASHNTIIEYDGSQHYFPIPWIKNKEEAAKKYNDNIRNDNIKNIYCKEKKIHLIRFSYKSTIKQMKEIIERLK